MAVYRQHFLLHSQSLFSVVVWFRGHITNVPDQSAFLIRPSHLAKKLANKASNEIVGSSIIDDGDQPDLCRIAADYASTILGGE